MKMRDQVRAARDKKVASKPKETVNLTNIFLIFSSIIFIGITWYLCYREKSSDDNQLRKQQFLESEKWREEEVSRVPF